MTDFIHDPHPRVLTRAQRGPAMVADEQIGFNGRLAAWMTRQVGSMWAVYFATVFMVVWIALAIWGPLRSADPYPFPLLLLLGNLVQLVLIFVILVGQQVLGRAADRRAMQTYEDAEAIFQEVSQLHDHLEAQDRILNRGVSLVAGEPHPWLKSRSIQKPVPAADTAVTLNGRIGAAITRASGTMWAFYAGSILQLAWIALAVWGPLRGFDPYPFAFLLFLSSLAQLLLMFIIMVGQEVLGQAGDRRSQQTFLDAEAILHECHRLQRHLSAQDRVIGLICNYIQDHAPEGHPIHSELGQKT
jgi:uncharacterized membrane protein